MSGQRRGHAGAIDAIDAEPTVAVTTPAPMARWWRRLMHAGRMLVGMPDYDAYLAHMRACHPERDPMSRSAFFDNRQQARYGGGNGRCC